MHESLDSGVRTQMSLGLVHQDISLRLLHSELTCLLLSFQPGALLNQAVGLRAGGRRSKREMESEPGSLKIIDFNLQINFLSTVKSL